MSPYRRRARAVLAPRQPRLQRHARDRRFRRLPVPVHRCGAGSAGVDRRCGRDRRSARRRRARSAAGDRIRGDTRRPSLIAVIAASEAWQDAGLALGEPGAGRARRQRRRRDRRRRSGSTPSSSATGWKRVTPYAIPVSIVGMISSEISIALELHGISHVVSTGCTSSTDAISYAGVADPRGRSGSSCRGGADACVTPGMIFGFSRMRAVSTHYNDQPAAASRPFDARPRRLRPRRRRVDDGPRARGSRARPRRARSTRRSTATARRAMPTTASRWIRTASRSSGRWRWRSSDPGTPLDEIGYVNFHGTSTRAQRRGGIALRAPAVRRVAPTACRAPRPNR